MEWLNQRTDSDTNFFGVVVKVFQIGDSPNAFEFRPVVFPNEWQKQQRRPKSRALSPKEKAYQEYFQLLVDELRENHKFTNAKVGQPQSWYTFSSGKAGIHYGASFAQGERARADLYIHQGDYDANKQLFDSLKLDKENIESEFGSELVWERLDEALSSRIAVYRSGTVEMPPEKLDEIRKWHIDNLLKFKKVFGSRIRDIVSNQESGTP